MTVLISLQNLFNLPMFPILQGKGLMKFSSGILQLLLVMFLQDVLSPEQMKLHVWICFAVQGWILLAKQTFMKCLFRDHQVQSLLNVGAYGKQKTRLNMTSHSLGSLYKIINFINGFQLCVTYRGFFVMLVARYMLI